VPSCVTPALKSVKNINIWNTVNYVHELVESALKNVVTWPGNQQVIIAIGLIHHIFLTLPH
jgi:hypothetical protein